MRKSFYAVLIFLTAVVLVGCKKDDEIKVVITLPKESITLGVGEIHKIAYTTSDESEVSFSGHDKNIITVSEDGSIEALAIGTTTVLITSKTDETAKVGLDVTVIDANDLVLAPGMEKQLNYKESDGYSFEVGNKYILSVDNNGLLTTELEGDTLIKVFKDDKLFDLINVTVLSKAQRINLEGPSNMFLNDIVILETSVYPNSSFDRHQYVVEDPSILEVLDTGEIIPKKAGTTTITVESLQDDETKETLIITIKDVFVVKSDVSNNEEIQIGNWVFVENVDLFKTINEALAVATPDSKVLLSEDSYDNNITIDKDVILDANNSTISKNILLTTSKVSIINANFTKDSTISSDGTVESFTFINNNVKNVSEDNFINVVNLKKATIADNDFKNLTGNAISLLDLNNNTDILVENNTIDGASNGILLTSTNRLSIRSNVKIYRNVIKNITNGFSVDLGGQNASTNAVLYARFNEVTDFSNKAVVQVDTPKFEYTFNYWGHYDHSNFENVSTANLLGYYESKEEILSADSYDPDTPIKVYLSNYVEEIQLGDEYELEPVSLPYSAKGDRILVAVDNMQITELKNNRVIIPKKSGMINLKIGSYSRPQDATEYEIKLTTDPGIHFELDNNTHGLTVGDKFTINSTPYPFDRVNDAVIYESSDSVVATVDRFGEVTIHSAGNFIITVSLANQTSVSEELSFESNASIDDNDLMDFLTTKQLTYSKRHEITLYGGTVYDTVHSDSVSTVVVDDIFRGENIIPVTPGFRPGDGMNPDIPNKYKFNPENVVWIVVHDTGNINVGADAELHSRYLYNQATQGGRKASWHFTVDSSDIYQHLPTNERGYHAGDGGSKPKADLVTEAFGGGNQNGIGIEMAVNQDGNVYKTWQNTARLVAELLHKYNLPLTHQTYHNDFSGKECPQTLRKSGLLPTFEQFVKNEYDLIDKFGTNDIEIRIESNNPEILSNKGIILKTPDKTTVVSYNLVIGSGAEEQVRTFSTVVEGLWR